MKLGKDTTPDVISVGLSAPDYVGHGLGPGGTKCACNCSRSIVDLEGFFEVLDRKASNVSRWC